MAKLSKPGRGEDLSQTGCAASLKEDAGADVVGVLDLGLDADPDLKTRTGQVSNLRREPEKKFPIGIVLVGLVLVGAVAAWAMGALSGLGVPSLSELMGK